MLDAFFVGSRMQLGGDEKPQVQVTRELLINDLIIRKFKTREEVHLAKKKNSFTHVGYFAGVYAGCWGFAGIGWYA